MRKYIFLATLMLSVVLLWRCGDNGDKPADGDDKKPAPYTSSTSAPNIVFILVDDLGMISTPTYANDDDSTGFVWAGSPTGAPAQYTMGSLAKFAQNAKQLNYMYATPSCAPSRAQLITGLYPYLTGITYPQYDAQRPATPETYGDGYLSTELESYVGLLQDAGYNTAFGGKWNLRYGMTDEQALAQGLTKYNQFVYNQEQHLKAMGFDETFGPTTGYTVDPTSGDTTYTGGVALIGNTVAYYPSVMDGQFYSDSLHTWVMDYLGERQSEPSTPFYLHYCMGLIHDSNPEAFPDVSEPDEQFAYKVDLVDTYIGNVLEQVQNMDNTVVIIAGDNGTERNYYSDYHNDTIQGAKLTFKSHGSRVPFLISWPGVIDTVPYDSLVDFADVGQTIAEIGTGSGYTGPVSGNSFLYQITNGQQGVQQPSRQAVYSQMNSTAFVANKNYLYLVNDVYNQVEGGSWYKISDSPAPDVLLSNPTDIPAEDSLLLMNYLDSMEIYEIGEAMKQSK